MYKTPLRYAAIIAFLTAILLTAVGGWANMTGKPIVITERHAWNDGLLMMLAAIFLLLLSFI